MILNNKEFNEYVFQTSAFKRTRFLSLGEIEQAEICEMSLNERIYLTKVKENGKLNIYWFSNIEHPHLPKNSSYMFSTSYLLEDISGLSDFDTSHVESFEGFFKNCDHLNDFSPVSKWNIKKTANIKDMYLGCPGKKGEKDGERNI